MSEKGLALVTGAGGAMGSACVERLSSDGYDIALMDINEDGLKKAVTTAKNQCKVLGS